MIDTAIKAGINNMVARHNKERQDKIIVKFYVDNGDRVDLLVGDKIVNRTIKRMLTLEEAWLVMYALCNYLRCDREY